MPKNPFEQNQAGKASSLNIVTSQLPGHKPEKLDPVEALSAFAETLQQYGLLLNGLPIADGAFHNVKTTDSTGTKKPGWYVLSDISGFLCGSYGNFKAGDDAISWSSAAVDSMTPSQISDYHRLRDEAKKKRAEQQKVIWHETAIEAQSVWDSGKQVKSHPYLKKKKISVGGRLSADSKHYKDWLMVPLYDESGDISSLQFINKDGEKRFMSGGRKAGCCYLTEGDTDTIYIAEGYATGETVTELTGKTCAVAWDAGNLMPVAEVIRTRYPNSAIVIAGDNDHEHECGDCGVMVNSGTHDCPKCKATFTNGNVNTGHEKATSAARALGVNVVFPECKSGESDFNDVFVNRGKNEALSQITQKAKDYDTSKNIAYAGMPTNLLNPPGILADIVHYYNATARVPQPGFAVQTALSIASVICARNFMTSSENFSSLYFLNIAKSTTGKEHGYKVVQKVLQECGKSKLFNAGYTSEGAVFSALMESPRHINLLDEFGRMLGSQSKSSSSNAEDAQTKLMEAIGRCDGVMKPKTYSTQTKQKGETTINDRVIYNPAITMLTMTTPETLFKNISNGSITDGFIGRFIIHESTQPRVAPRRPDYMPVPKRIKDWVEMIEDRHGNVLEFSEEEPEKTILNFDTTSDKMLNDFAQKQVDMCNSLDNVGLSMLPGRMFEFACRMSLIVTLAKNSSASIVDAESASWAIQYVKYCIDQTVQIMKMNVADSEFEADKLACLKAIRERGPFRVSELESKKPFSKHKPRDRKDIIDALVNGEFVVIEDKNDGGKGRPYKIIRAIEN